MTIAHALTIDVEEWFHDDWRPDRGADWDALPSTVASDVALLLDLLAQAGARATFFVLGDVARRQPAVVRLIAAAGHEIASHGDTHRKVATQGRDEFAADVRTSLAVLSDLTGERVAGYRAPYFLSRARDLWAIDVLAEIGLRYDASYVPVRWMPYLGRSIPRAPYRHPCGLWEFPLPFAERFGGWNLPYAGGGPLLRFLPYRVIDASLRTHERKVGPAVVYCHPWELDPETRTLPGTPRHVRLWKRLGRKRTLPALRRLLADFSFRSIREVYANELASELESNERAGNDLAS
jgi:polysaccharide deacetylase family protein (PEP-CTERM system associated)